MDTQNRIILFTLGVLAAVLVTGGWLLHHYAAPLMGGNG